MKKYASLLLMSAFVPVFCLCSCGQEPNGVKSEPEKVALPEEFKNTTFAHVAGNWNECGAVLVFDNNLNPEIMNVSSHDEFYDVEFQAMPIVKKVDEKVMYFLPFKVTDQIIDDGYFKDNVEYKFWLSYGHSEYYCAVSKNDDSLKEPEMILEKTEL